MPWTDIRSEDRFGSDMRGSGFSTPGEVAFRVNDCHMTQAMIAAGEGIALLPRLMLRPRHSGVRTRSLGKAAPIGRIAGTRSLLRARG